MIEAAAEQLSKRLGKRMPPVPQVLLRKDASPVEHKRAALDRNVAVQRQAAEILRRGVEAIGRLREQNSARQRRSA